MIVATDTSLFDWSAFNNGVNDAGVFEVFNDGGELHKCGVYVELERCFVVFWKCALNN